MVKNAKLTGASHGINSWLQQRLSAVFMLVVLLAFFINLFYMMITVGNNLSSWQDLFSNLGVKITVQLFILALIIHAWVGIRDVIMDYLHILSIKIIFYMLTILWLSGSLIYSFKILWL